MRSRQAQHDPSATSRETVARILGRLLARRWLATRAAVGNSDGPQGPPRIACDGRSGDDNTAAPPEDGAPDDLATRRP